MQLNYNLRQDKAYAGMLADLRVSVKESYVVDEYVPFGYGVVNGKIIGTSVKLPYKDMVKLVFDADLVTSNSIALDVNGDTDTVAFNTDHDTTMDDIVTALNNIDDVDAELDTSDTDNRTIIISKPLEDITVTATVTGGASQATATSTVVLANFKGFTIATHNGKDEDGNAGYFPNRDSVASCLRVGGIWVNSDDASAMNIDDSVYVIAGGSDKGKITSTSTDNIETDYVVLDVDKDNDIVKIAKY